MGPVKTKEDRKHAFLVCLEILTRKTGVKIVGCGCCGSPEIVEASGDELGDLDAGYGYGYSGEVVWVSHADAYHWRNFSKSIVR